MFNVGSNEFIVILFVALLLFGAKRIPELARSVGKGVRDFRHAMSGVETELRREIDLDGDSSRRPAPVLRPEPAAQPRRQLAPPPEGRVAAIPTAAGDTGTAGTTPADDPASRRDGGDHAAS